MAHMIDTIRQERIAKADKLRAAGKEPYPSKVNRTYTNKQVVADFGKLEGKQVTVVGRIMSWRDMGKLIFAKSRDFTGEIQLFIRTENLAAIDFKLFDVGDFVEATGNVIKTKTGEISVEIADIKIITKSIRPLPEKWSGISDPEIAFRKRYLDFIVHPEKIDRFVRKSKFWTLMRQFMMDKGFIEVETPVLENITGGADARPFVTHMNSLDQDFYLRISTELFQKRLIGAGFEKVYTYGPNFRNEGMDDEHLPEFQDIEWYWAYADYRDNMKLIVELFRYLAKEVWGKTKFTTRGYTFDLADEWEEIDYVKVIKEKLGIDVYTSTEEEMLEVIKKNGVDLPGDTNRQRLIDNLWKVIRKTIGGPAFLINHPKFMSPLAKPMQDNPELTERFQLIIGGSELGNGYSELNDAIDQLSRFEIQQSARDAGDDEAQMLDTDFVEMLEYGMPPTSGYGMSERVFWFLEDVSAREGTIFPAMKVLKENKPSDTKKTEKSAVKVSVSDKDRKPAVKVALKTTNIVQDKSKKIVMVLNKEVTGWKLTNTVGHLSAYLGNRIESGAIVSTPAFELKDGTKTPANSQYPVITLTANPGQMINLMNKVEATSGLEYLVYTEDMITYGDDVELAEALLKQSKGELKILGIGMFGENKLIDSLTKSYSLYK